MVTYYSNNSHVSRCQNLILQLFKNVLKEVYVPMKSGFISIKAILGCRFYFHRHIVLQHILISPGDLVHLMASMEFSPLANALAEREKRVLIM